MMKDKAFLQWLHGRLSYVHKENKNMDYMLKLQAIIDGLPESTLTPNSVSSSINMIDYNNMFGYMKEKKVFPINCETETKHERKFNLRDLPSPPLKSINSDNIFKNSI